MKNKNYLLLCLSLICLSTQITHSLSSSTFDWELIGDQNDRQTLNILQKYHNASAILHFIELTHNINKFEELYSSVVVFSQFFGQTLDLSKVFASIGHSVEDIEFVDKSVDNQ